jgi:hypothetical protein
VMSDIAFDPAGNLYGIDFSNLYRIDKTTAVATWIGSTGITSNALVFDANGTLYTANTALYTLNVTTGAATLIGNGGDAYDSSGDLAFVGGQLFLASLASGGGSDELFRIDPATGHGTLVGAITYDVVYGLGTYDDADLYGTAGTDVIAIDTTTGTGTLVLDYGGKGLTDAFGAAVAASPTDGVCGSIAIDTVCSSGLTATTPGLCSAGGVFAFGTVSGGWSWICTASNGGTAATCSETSCLHPR